MQWILGKIVTPHAVIAGGAVGMDGEKISYVGPAATAPRDPKDPCLDAGRNWVTPGLIDVHCHGAGGRDVLEADPAALHVISRTLAFHGVTSYLATTVVRKQQGGTRHLEVAAKIAAAGPQDCARILGIHIEGPYVNVKRKGMIRPDRIWSPDADDLKRLLTAAAGQLKMITMAPELPGAISLLPVMRDFGAVASMGHTDATFAQARAGFSAGIGHVTHLFNAMREFHHRAPGALGAVLSDSNVTAQLIMDGVHVHPSALSWTVRALRPESIVLITDALPSAGLPDGQYQYDGRPYTSKGGVATAPDGTLFGTTLTLDRMVANAMQFCGVDFPAAIRMATLNPARALKMTDRLGELAPGRWADLVIWNQDCKVESTFVAGKLIK
ncbi:MAG: N-acetylglucosamine-6-phosphate deacetylase [Candidatus Omnitrophica bacterium]|nr:N-acetylglucosamine-6-phosphate deacetylase [Candidatus Omnitrophota bacterium]